MQHPKELYRLSMFFLFIVCTGLTSCSKKDIPAENGSIADVQKIKEYLTSKNFDAREAVFEKDRVIVEGDIVFTMEDLLQRMADQVSRRPQTEQRQYEFLVSDFYMRNFTIYIHPAVPIEWRRAVEEAATFWNSVRSTKINMQVRSSGTVHVRTFAEPTYSIARANIPSRFGHPGQFLEINTPRFDFLSYDDKFSTVLHELGHIMGLAHTDTGEGKWIRLTPRNDPNSIMNSFLIPWTGALTAGDIEAVQTLYPINPR